MSRRAGSPARNSPTAPISRRPRRGRDARLDERVHLRRPEERDPADRGLRRAREAGTSAEHDREPAPAALLPRVGSGPGDTQPSTRSSRSSSLSRRWRPESSSSRPSRSPKATPTRSPTRSRTPCSTRSSKDDPSGRVACETLITTGLVVVAGEITTETYVDIPALVRKKIAEIGYTHSEWGFDANTCGVVVAIDEQSPDIAQGVDESYERQHDPADDDPLDLVGAGDQGMMFGYACDGDARADAAPDHARAQDLQAARGGAQGGELPYLRPDGKAQVTVRYEVDEHGRQRRSRSSGSSSRRSTRDGMRRRDADQARPDRARPAADPAARSLRREAARRSRLRLRQSDRQVRRRRADGRHRPHRAQDHRRHLRRRGAATAAARSRARTRRRSTARPRTPRATSRRTSSRPASPTAARSRSPTRSASRIRSRSRCGRSAPRRVPVGADRGARHASTSTSARRRSCATSTCVARSTRRPRRTATSAATTTTSRGSAPTRPTRSARPPAPPATTA